MSEFSYEQCEKSGFLAICKTLDGNSENLVKVTGKAVSDGHTGGGYFVVRVDENGAVLDRGGWVQRCDLRNVPAQQAAENYSVPEKICVRFGPMEIKNLCQRNKTTCGFIERSDSRSPLSSERYLPVEIDLSLQEFKALREALERKVAELRALIPAYSETVES